MNLEQAEANVRAVTKAYDDQRKFNQAVLDSNLDAGDRLLLRKAADISLLAAEKALTSDPP